MHYLIRRLALTATCCIFALYLSSCSRCGGCDTITATTGAAFNSARDSVALNKINNDPETLTLYLLAVNSSRSGNRNCSHKDMVICFEDAIDSTSLRVFCDKPLRLREGPIPAGTDLMRNTLISEHKSRTSPGQTNIGSLKLQADTSFVPGMYTFRLDGKTLDGKSFADTTTITWY